MNNKKQEIKDLSDLKVDDKVIIYSNNETYEGKISTIVRKNNALGLYPYFNINNNIKIRYVFEGGIKVYKL